METDRDTTSIEIRLPDVCHPYVRWSVPATVLGVVLLGSALRLRGLLDYWLNPDEGIYYSTLTSASFRDFWTEVTANAHPPVFYLLLRGVGWVTWDFMWIRVLTSLVFGVGAIWLFWRLGRELGGRGSAGVVSGLVAAGLLAMNAEVVALSQVIRPYMLLLTLLSLAFLCLLEYRSAPTTRALSAYVALTSLSVLTHYSAALALCVFAVLVAYFGLTGMERASWARLAAAQSIPFVIVGLLYALHVRGALESDLMGDALGAGGWLDEWLVTSPRDAWHSLVSFQILHVPSGFQGRTALLLLAAIVVSALSRERMIAVMCIAALAVALLASSLGLYPFGPSRHNAWLLVFSVPTLAWLAGRIVTAGKRSALTATVALVAVFAFGAPLERPLGGLGLRTYVFDEMLLLREELAPLVVGQMDPQSGPRLILMSEQPYDLLMPLYAGERDDVTMSPDSTLLSFAYGARRVVVTRKWDWNGIDDVRAVVRSLTTTLSTVVPESEPEVLVLAGGWGSSVIPEIASLEERGVILGKSVAVGRTPGSERILRLVALRIDWRLLAGT